MLSRRLANITFWGKPFLEIDWVEDQVILSSGVTVDKRANIVATLATFLRTVRSTLVITDIRVVGYSTPDLTDLIYDCSWYDFACDGLILHFNLLECIGVRHPRELDLHSPQMRRAAFHAHVEYVLGLRINLKAPPYRRYIV